MVFQRIISRVPGRIRVSSQPQRSNAPNFHPSFEFSNQASKPFPQITQKHNYGGRTRVLPNAMPRFLGNLGMKFGFARVNSVPSSLKFASSIHSVGQKEFEKDTVNVPVETEKKSGFLDGSSRRLQDINRTQPSVGYFEGLSRRLTDMDRNQAPFETGRDGRPFRREIGAGRNTMSMNLVRGIMKDNPSDMIGGTSQNYRSGVEQNADIVHIKLMRNNTFVTVTDSKGNKKMGASAGCLAEMKGGPKVSKYAAEATAEHVGRVAKSMGLKSVVMKVNGFTFFKRKKLAILSFRDGYTHSRSDRNPIVYIEDTTRKPHNGCRLRKQRRV